MNSESKHSWLLSAFLLVVSILLTQATLSFLDEGHKTNHLLDEGHKTNHLMSQKNGDYGFYRDGSGHIRASVKQDLLVDLPEGVKGCAIIFYSELGEPMIYTSEDVGPYNYNWCPAKVWRVGGKWYGIAFEKPDSFNVGYFHSLNECNPNRCVPVELEVQQ